MALSGARASVVPTRGQAVGRSSAIPWRSTNFSKLRTPASWRLSRRPVNEVWCRPAWTWPMFDRSCPMVGPHPSWSSHLAYIAHKSDLGLVRTGVQAPEQVRATFGQLEASVAAVPGAELEGVLVCEQAAGGVEMVAGIATDELFGPVVMTGIGGVAVEVYRDVTFRVPPFSRAEARRMIGELRAAVLLAGHRGAPPADAEALVDVIMNVQRIASDGVVTELDINPLLVGPDGAVALDALATSAAPERGDD
jgi:hypothetical protein